MLGSGDNSFGAASAAAPGDVWAVGNFLPDDPNANPDATLTLAAHYDGTSWSITPTPNAGPNFNTLFGVSATGGQAWAVGTFNDPAGANDRTLAIQGLNDSWQIVNGPDPATNDENRLGGVTAVGQTIWAVGYYKDNGRKTLIEKRQTAGP